ncbi:MAG: hypothetical protein CEE38_17815 [Planctomycetes bacterium B3_Pla]|nr:MAG: hypothetical protein CEE38_17815 [Planctomycetes bacterium B3_Pla]
MTKENKPPISFESGDKVIIIRRDLPEPIAYRGRNLIELEFDDDPKDFFEEVAFEKPPTGGTGGSFIGDKIDAVTADVEVAMRASFSDPRIFPNARFSSSTFRFVETPTSSRKVISSSPISRELQELDPEDVAIGLSAGKQVYLYKNLNGTTTYRINNKPQEEPNPHIYLVETYQLSSHLGEYGAGRVVKTFSLLPGERTKISVRTFLKSETKRKESSSILDSVTDESATDFQSAIESEQSDKQGYAKTFAYHAEAEAKASWGWGSAKVSGGVKGSTNATREEFSKNIASATEQHTAKASAKRDVEINTSYEVTEIAENETSIEREIENINVSRTLNFVFRQMNQEFYTFLHLTDVRVAFFNGYSVSRREVPLHQLDSLLDEIIKENHRQTVRDAVTDSLQTILDHEGTPHTDFIVDRQVDPQFPPYKRVNKEKISEYVDPITNSTFKMPGITMAVTKNIMRTDGVIVEALLGEGTALDQYSTQLQEMEIKRRDIERRLALAKAEKLELSNQVVRDDDPSRANLLVNLIEASKPLLSECYLSSEEEND